MIFFFHASATFFQTGWFVESLVTQVLVIFVIRTPLSLWRSRPHPLLFLSSFGVVLIGLILPFSPVAPFFSFVPLPAPFFLTLVILTTVYLAIMERVKKWYYRRLAFVSLNDLRKLFSVA
ncbi:MAG: hypothetical protein JSR80_00605 [Verrucomicrobia bacterium]|nr:hypothetical protein [Verrucomicrobiota bacterium]